MKKRRNHETMNSQQFRFLWAAHTADLCGLCVSVTWQRCHFVIVSSFKKGCLRMYFFLILVFLAEINTSLDRHGCYLQLHLCTAPYNHKAVVVAPTWCLPRPSPQSHFRFLRSVSDKISSDSILCFVDVLSSCWHGQGPMGGISVNNSSGFNLSDVTVQPLATLRWRWCINNSRKEMLWCVQWICSTSW